MHHLTVFRIFRQKPEVFHAFPFSKWEAENFQIQEIYQGHGVPVHYHVTEMDGAENKAAVITTGDLRVPSSKSKSRMVGYGTPPGLVRKK